MNKSNSFSRPAMARRAFIKTTAGLSASVLLAAIQAMGADYFVANNGSDLDAGTFAAPFLTISKAAAVMQAGDQCWIRAGVYRETVTPTNHDLTFMPYNGESVTISGCDVVNGAWQTYQGQVQMNTVTQRVMQVFLDGQRMNLASYPDEPAAQNMLSYASWAPTTTSTPYPGAGSVVFPGMSNQPANYWVGGSYSGRNGSNPFSAARGEIIASTNKTLVLTNLNYFWRSDSGSTASYLGDGSGYIINCLNALDAPTEWYWSSNNLYFQPPSGINLTQSVVEARTRLWGFNLTNCTGIVVEGVTFDAASLNLGDAQNCLITNCTVLYPGPWTSYDAPTPTNYAPNPSQAGQPVGMDYGGPDDGSCGVFVSGLSNRISHCYIAHSWGAALRLDGTNNVVEDSLLEDLNWLGRRIGGVQLVGFGNQVLRCSIRHTGQAGIDGGNRTLGFGEVGYNLVVASNLIADVALLTSDTGGFYMNNQSSTQLVNAVVAYNTILVTSVMLPATVAGIYFDNSTCGGLINHNAVDVSPAVNRGIRLNNTTTQTDYKVYNNTVIGGNLGSIVSLGAANAKSRIAFINNLATGTITGYLFGSNNLANQNAASNFVNPGIYNFQLLPTSPAVDAGAIIPGITDGYAGSAPDVGAYESGVAAAFPPPPPSFAVSNVTVTVGISDKTNNAVFNVVLANYPVPLAINFATADGTATAGSDYAATNGTLVFLPGQTNQQFSVPVFDDTTGGLDKNFTVILTETGFGLTSSATGTITASNSLPNITFGTPGSGDAAITTNWVVPAGISSVTVQMWGGGGGGGSVHFGTAGSGGAGGGGGGAYTVTTVAVTPGNTYAITVGRGGTGATANNGVGFAGSASTFPGAVSAAGGAGGAGSSGGSGGAGGAVTGAGNHKGGPGGQGIYAHGGVGGGSGSSSANGNATAGPASTSDTTSVAGSAGPGGGAGAGGQTNTDTGFNGNYPGGGGGGGHDFSSSSENGGNGGNGQVILTYSIAAGSADIWVGNVDANWDTTSPNWTNSAGSNKYVNFDSVQFDDTASNFTVNVVSPVIPASVLFTNDSQNYVVGGAAIAGSGSLQMSGSATLTLTGTNSYSGGTTISAGTLQLGDGTSGHDGAISGDVTDNSALVYNRFGSSSYGGVISGSGTVTLSGPGTQTLTGTNTYTGNTTVAGGILAIQQPTLAANSTITVTNGGLLELDFAGPVMTNPVAALVLNGINAAPGVHNNATDSAFITGAGSLLVASSVAANPTNISYTISGNQLTLTWPEDHPGWMLQAQTDTLNVGLSPASNAWVDLPATVGITATNLPMNPASPAVFYRLRSP